MNKVEKTVTEWLGEYKVNEKKIQKLENTLNGLGLYIVEYKEDISKYKSLYHDKESNIMNTWQSLNALRENQRIIRQALLEFNATYKFSIAGKQYSIASALEKIRDNKNKKTNSFLEMIRVNLRGMNARFDELLEDSEMKEMEYRKILSNKNNQSSHAKDEEAVKSYMESYKIEKIDFLHLENLYENMVMEDLEFMEEVNIQLNIINATNKLTLELNR